MNSESTTKVVVTVVFCFSVVDGLMSHAVDKTNWSAAPWPQHLSSQKYVRICKKCINKWHDVIHDLSSITAWCEIKLTIANVNVNISHSTNSSSLPIKEFLLLIFLTNLLNFHSDLMLYLYSQAYLKWFMSILALSRGSVCEEL